MLTAAVLHGALLMGMAYRFAMSEKFMPAGLSESFATSNLDQSRSARSHTSLRYGKY